MAELTMTLGLRFRRHVAGWVMDTVPTPPPGELEALCARADAAERLAVAVAVVADAAEQVESTLRDDRIAVKREWLAAKDEGDNALAAWRALGEVADG